MVDIFGNFSKLSKDNKKRHVQDDTELEFSYSDAMLEGVGRVENRSRFSSVFVTKAFVVLIFSILIFRLFMLQVVQGESNQKIAEGNRIRPRVIDAPRGVITDKDGVWLARNKPNFALALYPSDLPKKKTDREETYKKISEISGLPTNEIKKKAEQNGLMSLDMVTLKENISHDDALLLEKKINGIPGVTVANKASREYAILPGISHLLGYTGLISPEDIQDNSDYYLSDKIGKTGLEAQYEHQLKGKHGVEQIEVDSKGNIIRVLVDSGNREPMPGYDINLYLDRGLQQKTADALKANMEAATQATGAEVNAGTAIVMDVKTGGILSMVSLPDYDDNLFANGISNADYQKIAKDPSYPLLNRAIGGVYPPGSVSKIILASAGLAEGVISPLTSLVTPAAIKIGEYVFPDWKDHSYESTNVERAIAESNDIFFYAIGGGFDKVTGIGIDKIKKYWQLFGLGEKTGIDLPGEAKGLLPDGQWKKNVKNEAWYIGDTYHVSIGQGDLLVTPLQMVRATAAIANGGKLLQPQLVKKITDHDGNILEEFGSRVERQNFLSQDIIKTVQEGMRMTITDGSARNLQDVPVPVAGKTGTAQFLNNEKTHAWFECYAPYDNPQIAVIVMVEGGGEGHDIAAPVADEILKYYFSR